MPLPNRATPFLLVAAFSLVNLRGDDVEELKLKPFNPEIRIDDARPVKIKLELNDACDPNNPPTWTISPEFGFGKLQSAKRSGPVKGCKVEYLAPTRKPDSCVVCRASITIEPADGAPALETEIIFTERPYPGGLFERIIFGVETAGGASAELTARLFMDLNVSLPIGRSRPSSNGWHSGFGPSTRVFVNPRLTSIPQTAGPSIKSLVTGSYPANDLSLTTNELVQGFEVLGGIQHRIGHTATPRRMFGSGQLTKTTVALFLSGGFITPVGTPMSGIKLFQLPDAKSDSFTALLNQYPHQAAQIRQARCLDANLTPITSNCTARTGIAFLPMDRPQFYREYYGGIRFQGHYFKNNLEPDTRPQFTLDFAVGQSELVTAGRMRGWVGRVDIFYPLPLESANFLYLFGSGLFQYTGARFNSEIIPLQPFTDNVPAVSSPNLLQLTTRPSNRDYFRVGFGINFATLIEKLKPKK